MAAHSGETTGYPTEKSGTAVIVQPQFTGPNKESRYRQSLDDKLGEVSGLARAIGLDVAALKTVRISRPAPGYLIGKGSREDIGAMAAELEPDVIIVNHALTPIQQRNLERQWNTKVIDRTGLILEIFGARARTSEGKIQVELAALEYQKSRLVRSWTHLERQRGGAGFMGGPGETQIELDRRLIVDRIAKLKKELKHVTKTRDLQRRSRERVPFPIVALVGYTNAGKSTLFNFLTGADVYAEDLPFATLDPTMRKVTLRTGQEIIVSDTVGFITDLPTHLVASFRATLEQVDYADVILHVLDISLPDSAARREEVIRILGDIGIHYDRDERVLEVWNKIDALADDVRADAVNKARFSENAVAVSAVTGEGTEALLDRIESFLTAGIGVTQFSIPASDGRALAWLHANGQVLEQSESKGFIKLDLKIDSANLGRFRERFSYAPLNQKQANEKHVHDNAS